MERAGKCQRAPLHFGELRGLAGVCPPPNARVETFIKPVPSSPLGPLLTGGRILWRPGLDSRRPQGPLLTVYPLLQLLGWAELEAKKREA